jgi:lysophospholipase L1-like esterase
VTLPLWIVALLAIPGLVVALELATRWWLRFQNVYYVFPPGQRLHLHPDRDVFPQLEPLVRFEINSEGERGEAVPRVRPGEKLCRILVAGGSQPEGYALDQGTSWPGALQRLLRAPAALERLGATAVHVGNIARSGVGSQALDVVLERVLPRYPRLQMIIILVGASDVFRWLEQGAPPHPPSPVPEAELFRCHPRGPFGWMPHRLAIVEVLRRLRQRWLRPIVLHERAGRWFGKARAMRARATDIRTQMPDPTPLLDQFEHHLRRLLTRAQAHADRVILVRQPWFDKEYTPEEAAHMWNGGVGQAWRQEVTTYYSFDILSRLMGLVDVTAARVAREVGVEQLDLMPLLERSLRTYYDLCHLTPAGSRAVAAAVSTVVLRQLTHPNEVCCDGKRVIRIQDGRAARRLLASA